MTRFDFLKKEWDFFTSDWKVWSATLVLSVGISTGLAYSLTTDRQVSKINVGQHQVEKLSIKNEYFGISKCAYSLPKRTNKIYRYVDEKCDGKFDYAKIGGKSAEIPASRFNSSVQKEFYKISKKFD